MGDAAETLAVTRFPAERPWASLVIAGAMGVGQDFYHPLAHYLAANGIHVVTFDYRGMGASRPSSLRGFKADVSSWAEMDLEEMLGRGDAKLPLLFVGHSLGGQLLGVPASNHHVRAAITVTAGSGWYKYNDRMPLQVRIFWFAAIPALTPLFGYFPGKPLRMVGDLPRGVATQWRRWCLHPDYLLCEGERYRTAFDRVTAPIRSYSFEDDPIITRQAVDNLHTFYRNACVERCHIDPATLSPALPQGGGRIRSNDGGGRIGHFGYFSAASESTLWAESLAWLRSAVETA